VVYESCGGFLVYGFSVYDYTKTACVFYQVSFQQGVNGRGLYINWAMNAGMSYHT